MPGTPAAPAHRNRSGDSDQTLSRLLSPGQLAALLGVPVATVYRWRSSGEGHAGVRVGSHVRFRVEDIEGWLDHRRDVDSRAHQLQR
jgi:excisionase family DNA binding protein